ncbi:MAG: flagellar basal body P-ring protein FlgI [Phycisphaerae bacterium]|nr:flagellar basal body P-ring protein FlgI [Phycisphaerae bacterium]MDD5381671.1 flagellar basal body P-ring protein FlgI [Phycisphaerae bacterium]
MNSNYLKPAYLISILFIVFFINGCGRPAQTVKEPNEPAAKIDLGATIGSLAEVFPFDPIPVEGYGLVGGLSGTGSSECPAQIREYLKQYILKQLDEEKVNVDELINSPDTAVVLVQGIMPTAVPKNQYFDVSVSALPGTQTTSLEGGWLYGAELKAIGGFGVAMKPLATAKGPVFVDTLSPGKTNKKNVYIMAGGRVLNEYEINMGLSQPDLRIASLICSKLNGRFGYGAARAVSASQVELKVPAAYKKQKQRFVSIVKAIYLSETPEATRERISTFIQKLAVSKDKYTAETALEAIGNESLSKLAALLNSSQEQVRLRTARCMLNLGSDDGLNTLREIALNKDSAYRVEALEAITTSAKRNDAIAIARKVLRDNDPNITLAAYENLRKLDDLIIRQTLIARNFYLEQISQTEYKGIFVYRSGQPRIVLFGAPIYCRDDIFIQSEDGSITINAPAGQKYVSIIRKHPKRPNVMMQLKSSFELGDIIQTLCEEPLKKAKEDRRGLNVSYTEAIALLKQMCDKGAVEAEFQAGPLPKIDLIIKRK